MKNKIKDAIIIIPARGGSKRIRDKNLKILSGKPLIEHTIFHALNSKFSSEIYVSTDSRNIKKVCNKYSIHVIKRPKKISDDLASSEDALLHTLDIFKSKNKYDPEYVIFLQCSSPFRKKNDINNAYNKIIKEKSDSLLSVTESKKFLWAENNHGNNKAINYDIENRKREQDFKGCYEENGSIYISKSKNLRKYNNRLSGKISIFKMDFWSSVQIDEKHDLELARWISSYKIKNFNIPKLENLEMLVFDFDGVFTNNKFSLNKKGKESVTLSRADGLAIKMLNDKKIPMLVLSSEKNEIVRLRCQKLGISYKNGIENKIKYLKNHFSKNGINKKNVLYIGNDINDFECIKYVGLPVAVNDAVDLVKKNSKIILESKGGNGAVRELVSILSGI